MDDEKLQALNCTCGSVPTDLPEIPLDVVGRYAPSPTGRMHAGNIFAALATWLVVRARDGRIVLRIEDLDPDRSRAEFADAIMHDLSELGLDWDGEPQFQSKNTDYYAEAFSKLKLDGRIYPCFCTRAQLVGGSAPHATDRFVYPGTCKTLSGYSLDAAYKAVAEAGRQAAMRFCIEDVRIAFNDVIQGKYSQSLMRECGDFIVRRSDGGFAYNLASVVDDSLEGINMIVRGVDLAPSTPGQICLQQALGYGEPIYAHIPLMCAPDGRRLAKRNAAASYADLLTLFKSPAGVLGHISYIAGLISKDQPITAEELLKIYKSGEGEPELKLRALWGRKTSITFTPA